MCLKLNLNKTKMHTLIRIYDSRIPRLKDCSFTRHGGVYWMEYQHLGSDSIRATLLVALGVALLRLENPDTGDERVYQVSNSYLKNMGLVKTA